MKKLAYTKLILLFALLLGMVPEGMAQEGQRVDRYDLHPMHWVRFRARNLFDRNLIYTPVWNIGNTADSDLRPNERMRWPGSEGLAYGEYFCFYVGVLVTDMSAYRELKLPERWDGNQYPILTDSYFRIYGPSSNAQLSVDRTHQCTWKPYPGYFNDDVGGWIRGINEDVNGNGELEPEEDINFNDRLDLYLEPPEGIIKSLAMSTDKRTWPAYWPGGSYIGDDRPPSGRPPRTTRAGLRQGLWNGEYGAKTISDQESVYLMDDHENDWWNQWKPENYWPMKNPDGAPDTTPWKEGGIAGAGLEVESRGYAWFHPLAEDLLVNLYRTRNYSDHVLDRVVTGIYADADIAGQGTENKVDYIVAEYDYEGSGGRTDFDIMYQWHQFPEQLGTQKRVGVFGFAFLESPGIAYNFQDDDADSLWDESMFNGLDDDGDWAPFGDIGLDRRGPEDPKYDGPDEDGTEGNGIWDTEDLNLNGALDRGEDLNKNDRLDQEPEFDDVGTDGIGPSDYEWRGPDPDGSECNGLMDLGEPNFDITDIDEADQAGLKHVYVYEVNNDLLSDRSFWEKYLRKEDQRMDDSDDDIAFTFGARAVKLEQGKWERFTIALIMGQDNDDIVRNKSIMQRIYNANYRFLTPPVQPTLVARAFDKKVQLYWDTEAERSKDPFFGEDFEGYRVYKSTDPKFLDIKTITDAFGNVLLFQPLAIYDKADGLKGPHPVAFPSLGVHYDMGKDSGLRHSYQDTLVDNGRTYYYAVTAIDAGNDEDFFERGLVSLKHPLKAMPSESPFNVTVNRLGRIVFRSRNTASVVPTQMAAGYVDPHVDTSRVAHVSGFARGGVQKIEVFNRDHVNVGHEYELTYEDDGWLEKLDSTYTHGSITGVRLVNRTTGKELFNLRDSTHEAFIKDVNPILERTLFEGIHFDLSWPVPSSRRDRSKGIKIIKWNARGRTTREWQHFRDSESNIYVGTLQLRQEGYPLPYDFEIRVEDHMGADTSWSQDPRIPSYPLNFTTWNVSDPNNPRRMKVKVFYDLGVNSWERTDEMFGQIWDSTRVVILFGPHILRNKPNYYSSWEIRFFKNIPDSLKHTIPPKPGDVYRFRTIRGPDRHDVYRFKVEGGIWNAQLASDRMKDIYVVPDPYVVSNSFESIYNIGGRSSRKMEFVNLPPQCTIKIFTAAGKHVKTLEHDSPVDFGRHTWDLTTEDGPEIAFGVYFYVVETAGLGVKRGKFAVIK